MSIAAGRGNDLVHAELLANVKQIKPGESFLLGVRLHIEPGWHVYWKNPGDAGQATQVKWDLPPGFSAGQLQFPAPMRFDDAGVVMFGYTDDVMLLAKITPPAHGTVDQAAIANISAQVSWLVCLDVCLPGKTQLRISLPVGDQTIPNNAALFRQWSARVPVKADAPDSPVTSHLSASDSWQIITLTWKKPVAKDAAKADVFPNVDSAIELRNVQTRRSSDSLRISYQPVVRTGLTPASRDIEWVIAYDNAAGERRGVSVTVSLPNAAPGPASAVTPDPENSSAPPATTSRVDPPPAQK